MSTPDSHLRFLHYLQTLFNSLEKEKGKFEPIVYNYGQKWLELLIKLLKPVILENSLESNRFLEDNITVSSDKVKIENFTENFTENLCINQKKSPFNFYINKYETRTTHLFISGFIAAILAGFASHSYILNTNMIGIISATIVAFAVFVFFSLAAISELQKSKTLQNNYKEFCLFQEERFDNSVDKSNFVLRKEFLRNISTLDIR